MKVLKYILLPVLALIGLIQSTFATVNPLVTLANDTGSGAIANAWDIMAWPIGYVVYFIIGLALISMVIFALRKHMG